MKISRPQIIDQGTDVVYRADVSVADDHQALWYCLDPNYGSLISSRSDALLAALLIPAMARGEDIHLEGSLSERIYYNLSGPYQHLLRHIIPSLHFIQIYPADLQTAGSPARGVATGFSAGIDSFSVLADHYYSDPVPGFRITHLLYNNVGSHGSGGEALFRKRYERLKPVAEKIGLPFVAVNSNLKDFYEGFSFEQTHTIRNASVALLLQQGIGRFMYGSAYSYDKVFIGQTTSMAYSDAITLPLLSTHTLDAFSAGSEYTRVEKTLRVANIEDSYGSLDVCSSSRVKSGNCSRCSKCLRTLLTLEVAGYLDRYQAVFDLDLYRQIRKGYIAEILSLKGSFSEEIIRFAADKGVRFPLRSRLLGATPGYMKTKDLIRALMGR